MKSLAELAELRQKSLDKMNLKDGSAGKRVVVGMATCGIAAGARPVLNAFTEEIEKKNIKDTVVEMTGCVGMCVLEPMVDVYDTTGKKTTYVHVTPEKAQKIVEEHIVGGKPVAEYTIGNEVGSADADKKLEETDFFSRQTRVALRNCGVINPEDINEYIANEGYQAIGKVLNTMKPEEVIQVIKDSGLRGRGGAGFPTGQKWTFAAASKGDVKYVACNADEGDPGAFMDRSVLEGDPHSVLEAMTIAGYATGAHQGYIYVRAEYPTAIKRLNIAIKQAHEYGLLGDNILNTGFNFDIELRLGAGAFVCGEETALMNSIEGKRGEPRPRPPFPAVKGIFDKPSMLNNVETYANICPIILKGADWFASMGKDRSKGTKVFAVAGKIQNSGLVEIEMGMPLREVIYNIGGGVPGGKAFKAAQTGGPSGGCIPASLIDTPMTYEDLTGIGSMMGSGGLIVMDEDDCMVDIAKFFLGFTVDESCGKCPPCRIGTKRMLEILEKITTGRGELEDIDRLEALAKNIQAAALCGLGQTAPNPVLSTLRYYRDEYEAHCRDKKCPAGSCKDLIQIKIDPSGCKSCGICAKVCPVACITGEKKVPYEIDQTKCIKCGACVEKCPFKAIHRG